jgi:hypothetical protein
LPLASVEMDRILSEQRKPAKKNDVEDGVIYTLHKCSLYHTKLACLREDGEQEKSHDIYQGSSSGSEDC